MVAETEQTQIPRAEPEHPMADTQHGSANARLPRPKPSGWRKRLMALPTWLYAHGLGFLFAERLVVLVHRGRETGTEHRTTLELLEHRLVDGEYRILSGWGRASDWYRNLQAAPPIALLVSGKRLLSRPRVSSRTSPDIWDALHAGREELRTALAEYPVVGFRPIGKALRQAGCTVRPERRDRPSTAGEYTPNRPPIGRLTNQVEQHIWVPAEIVPVGLRVVLSPTLVQRAPRPLDSGSCEPERSRLAGGNHGVSDGSRPVLGWDRRLLRGHWNALRRIRLGQEVALAEDLHRPGVGRLPSGQDGGATGPERRFVIRLGVLPMWA